MTTIEYILSGRVSAAPETRVLPSGDEVVSFRLIVRRSAAARRRSKQVVDTIECSAWSASMRRTVGRLEAGAEVEVTGELRRRFTRGADQLRVRGRRLLPEGHGTGGSLGGMTLSATGLGSTTQSLSTHYDLAMLDLDGVVYVGPDAVPGAADALKVAQANGMRLAYITNNAATDGARSR